MYPQRRLRTSTTTPVTRERNQRPVDDRGELAVACREACREVEAARLVLAELGRRHGPLD